RSARSSRSGKASRSRSASLACCSRPSRASCTISASARARRRTTTSARPRARSARAPFARDGRRPMNEPVPRILLERYSANERTIHWIVAVLFVVAALSGLALFHPSLFGLSALFGGGTWTRILHPFAGVLMTVAFVLLAVAVAKDNVMRPADWQWLKRIQIGRA